jgi:lipoprotein-anchoring transpeptidase ErfK/SrfK
LRVASVKHATCFWGSQLRGFRAVAVSTAIALLVAACGGGSKAPSTSHGGSGGGSTVRLSIAPADGGVDSTPGRGITVTAAGGRISNVTVRTGGDPVTGSLNAAGTVWHSNWALNVSQHYTVSATAAGTSGRSITRTSSFRTLTPANTFTTKIIEGYGQMYGVGMPIILYFSSPVTDRAAVERALEIKTSKPIVGAWYWDSQCGTAPVCAYFRTRIYWTPGTKVSFTGHLNGVEAAPGVYGAHTLTQSFTIAPRLSVVANTAGHYMNVYRNGKLFAHWPISSGRPGDDTPNGNYLTIEKANPVDMVGPGYNIEVPYSVRFTWSGDYLHDAYWSTGEQGFTNVSHGCVNMSPTDAQIYYNMAVPGDPVKITGSPRPGDWDNGWTMWFLPWKQWLHGSALHEVVQAGPDGSTFTTASASAAATEPAPLQLPRVSPPVAAVTKPDRAT